MQRTELVSLVGPGCVGRKAQQLNVVRKDPGIRPAQNGPKGWPVRSPSPRNSPAEGAGHRSSRTPGGEAKRRNRKGASGANLEMSNSSRENGKQSLSRLAPVRALQEGGPLAGSPPPSCRGVAAGRVGG